MPEYIVKTGDGRNLIIAADYYKQDTSSAVYNFYKSAEVSKKAPVLVGSVNAHAVLAVLEFEDAYQADYDNADPLDDEDDHDDTCLDCRLDNFVESSAFFDSVWSIVDFYLSPDNQDDPSGPEIGEPSTLLGNPRTDIPAPSFPVPEIPTAVPDQVNEEKYPIEHWRSKNDTEWWGFNTPNGFIHFTSKQNAEDTRGVVEQDSTGWAYLDLTGATRLED